MVGDTSYQPQIASTQSGVPFPPVYRADVVQTAAGHEVAGGRVGAGHHPGGPQRDGMHLVGGVAVPYDQLTVLGCRHEVPAGRGGTGELGALRRLTGERSGQFVGGRGGEGVSEYVASINNRELVRSVL